MIPGSTVTAFFHPLYGQTDTCNANFTLVCPFGQISFGTSTFVQANIVIIISLMILLNKYSKAVSDFC